MEPHPDEHKLAPPWLTWGVRTDPGRVRTANEDAYHIAPELGLFVISDGMGGHRGGAKAAGIVVEDLPVMIETALAQGRSERPRAIRRLFARAIREQCRQLRLEQTSETGYRDMGATLVLVLVQKGRAFVGNLGDSRAYRLRARRLVQISRDHSVVAELIAHGTVDPDEAADHEAQGQLTHYVGMEDEPAPHIRSFALHGGDRLLLCTDGLTDAVPRADVAGVLREVSDPQKACDVLVEAANAAGGPDNITTLVVDYRVRESAQGAPNEA
ncbi:MAG TPA: serine/threonine-protein phosphatase [Phycisphaerales bacterium]|nr:serine/threonine-protein phosphatase [Phycisphaerales bacterium]